MSIPVELDTVPERIGEYGTLAYLATVSDDLRPHIVSVQVTVGGGDLRVPAGRRTRANLAARPTVTLVWPPGPDGRYSLIVDGSATGALQGDEPLSIKPTGAVLHVLARPTAEGDSLSS